MAVVEVRQEEVGLAGVCGDQYIRYTCQGGNGDYLEAPPSMRYDPDRRSATRKVGPPCWLVHVSIAPRERLDVWSSVVPSAPLGSPLHVGTTIQNQPRINRSKSSEDDGFERHRCCS